MFRFRLESVLNYRRTIEENLLKELSELRRQLSLEEDRLKMMIFEKDSHINDLGSLQKGGVTLQIEDIKLYFSYLNGLELKIKNQGDIIKKCRERADKKLVEVIDAMKNRKILEVIKERGYREYTREINLKEQRLLDEIAVNRFTRDMYGR
ncbi:MAG: flagellar export protein FliJ [Nitrospinae bacterium]|nr:flagellar export protein FliJ [Nitrospinota bacterium]